MWKQLEVTIKGKSDGDLELAMEEVLSSIRQGNTVGFDSNDTGRFKFEIREVPKPRLS